MTCGLFGEGFWRGMGDGGSVLEIVRRIGGLVMGIDVVWLGYSDIRRE